MSKDPSQMTDKEKVIYKVEVFKQMEDVDEVLTARIRMIEEERGKIQNAITQNTNTITVYNDAVDKIGRRA